VTNAAAAPKPGTPEAKAAMGRALRLGIYYAECAHDIPKAVEAYRAALKAAPDEPVALNVLGYTLADRGTTPAEFAEAVELTRKAVDAAPDEPAYRDSYGWALFKRGDEKQKDLEGARRALREAADDAPELAEIRYHLGAVYARLGLNREASQELGRALTLAPDLAAAKDTLAALPAPYNAPPAPPVTVAATPTSSPTPAATPAAAAQTNDAGGK
jgi:tetratricopeptide (TPR) repeat protein